MGIYYIKYTPPQNIRVPILAKKTKNNGLIWDLHEGKGYYTNVQIEDALSVGYKIESVEGEECHIWEKKADIFLSYIKPLYEKKQQAGREGNKGKRSLYKLLMNALYGKFLQHAHQEETIIIHSYRQYLEFRRDYRFQSHNLTAEDGYLMVVGQKKEKKRKITKPSYIGTFILDYAKRIMLQFMKMIDPTLQKPVFHYTDTDSLYITYEAFAKIKASGKFKIEEIINDRDEDGNKVKEDKREEQIEINKAKQREEVGKELAECIVQNVELGELTNDIDNEALILKARFESPKCYVVEYLDMNNEICFNDNGKKRIKGFPIKRKGECYKTFDEIKYVEKKKDAKGKWYETGKKQSIRDTYFSKINLRDIEVKQDDEYYITSDMYFQNEGTKIYLNKRITKIATRRTKNQILSGVNPFTILYTDIQKTFKKSPFDKMYFDEVIGEWFPFNYVNI